MLEIIILIVLGKKIYAIAKSKGRRGSLYVLLLILLWFGGEFSAGFAAAIISAIAFQQLEPVMVLFYLFALVGAVLGAVGAFQIAKNLPPKHATWLMDEDDELDNKSVPEIARPRSADAGHFYNPDEVRRLHPQSGEFKAGDE